MARAQVAAKSHASYCQPIGSATSHAESGGKGGFRTLASHLRAYPPAAIGHLQSIRDIQAEVHRSGLEVSE